MLINCPPTQFHCRIAANVYNEISQFVVAVLFMAHLKIILFAFLINRMCKKTDLLCKIEF